MTGLLLRRATLDQRWVADVRVAGPRVVEIGDGLRRRPGEREIDAAGALLLPGLHDHHLHLLATAASTRSVRCGPPTVTSPDRLGNVLAQAARSTASGRWVRGIGYDDAVAGVLDRWVLDAWVPDHPVRVQHRSGALWMINSAGLVLLGADDPDVPPGVERDEQGRPTGRLWRVDDWLRDRLGPRPLPDLETVGRQLAAHGVTGVTDATPDLDSRALHHLLDAVASGVLPQRLCLLGIDAVPEDLPPVLRQRVSVGPRKIVLPDHDLPDLPTLVHRIRQARSRRPHGRRPVAVHCVTRAALVLLLAALDEAGTVPGDRIEHAAVVPADCMAHIRDLGLTVVTQPSLLAERGDSYLRDVEPEDIPGLYRHGSLIAAGVPVGLSTDAPYTIPDPWAAIRAASNRTTPTGQVIGPDECVDPRTALAGFTTPPDDPGGIPRRVQVGMVADLCLVRSSDVGRTERLPDATWLTLLAGAVTHAP